MVDSTLTTALLKGREAARVLSVSLRTLWTMKACGSLPYVKFGRSVRFIAADLEKWIESRRVKARREDATPYRPY